MSSFEHNEIKSRIHHYLVAKTNFLEIKDNMQEDQLRAFVNAAIDKLCQETKLTITMDERISIIRDLVASIVSLGPLRPFIEDPTISEIMVNGCMTIRKFSRDLGTIDDLIERRTLNKQMAAFLIAAIKAKLNIVFCGSTGSGKTTLLNVLSSHIPEHERIITIEDTSELRLMQEHVVSLQAKPANMEGKGEVTIRDLFVNSLRMRPDRIIIGEVRGHEILDLVQSIASGHAGSLAIVHADSPKECFNRMITMMLISGIRLSGEQIQQQLATSIDLIVYVELFLDGIRRITNITDLRNDKDRTKASLEDIFTFKQERVDEQGQVIGDWVINRQKPSFYDKFVKRNIQLPEGFFI